MKSNNSNRWRIAIVIQRYGTEVNGGAELHARWLAEALLPIAEVHVLTTNSLSYLEWDDFYPTGLSEINGVIVHRFPVEIKRVPSVEGPIAADLLSRSHTYLEEIDWLPLQGPYSPTLFHYLEQTRDSFDAFFFATFMYAQCFFGMPRVAEKAVLLPHAHDDHYLYMTLHRALFHMPVALIYNTEAEKRLVNRVTGNAHKLQLVAGLGVNVPDGFSESDFRSTYGIDDDFILYIGRVEKFKGIPELLDNLEDYRRDFGSEIKLVLIGREVMELPDDPRVISLGFVSERDKFGALAACKVLVNPSPFESLSIVLLEAMAMKVPVLVNGNCDVLKDQCIRSNAGLYYHDSREFSVMLHLLLYDEETRLQLAEQGLKWVNREYSWDVLRAKYSAILQEVAGDPTIPADRDIRESLHELLLLEDLAGRLASRMSGTRRG